MTPNIGGWYKRKWKVYTPTDEETKWGIETWIALVILIISISLFFYFL